MGSLSLLQGIFPTQGLNPGLPLCRRILYWLSHQESPICIYVCVHVCENCSVMSDSVRPHGLYSPWNSPGRNTGVSSLSLLQGVFPTQRLNPGLYPLSHKGSPRILEWVSYPFSSRSSQPRNQTGALYCRQIFYQLSYQTNPLLFE